MCKKVVLPKKQIDGLLKKIYDPGSIMYITYLHNNKDHL